MAGTGPQQLAFAGLRAVQTLGLPAGQINAVKTDGAGNIFLLIDQKDGVRILKTDAAGATLLAQAQIGAQGDIGLAMALDPAGNVYVTGTTASGALTATAGAAFVTPTGTTINGFVAKFDTHLNTYFVSFTGAASISASAIAATADAVFITGSIFSATLPATTQGVIQTPAYGTTGNGFVEKFSSSGSTLLYATYLSGAGGNTSATAIAADASDNAYVGGYTSAAGYPTVAAIVPEMLGPTSGFVTKLSPAGDGFAFSTFVPGAGVSSLAIDPAAGNLLVSGGIALGQFPVSSVAGPLVPLMYQVLVRMPLDGSDVLSSTALAPGTGSFVAPTAAGAAWVGGDLALPLLPLAALSSIGNSYAARLSAAGTVDQTARFGGIAAGNNGYASAPVNVTSVAADGAGDALFAGSFASTASASLLATQTFDLPLLNAPTAAFPTEAHGAVLPSSGCSGSLCPGSAAYLAMLVMPASAAGTRPALALSVDDAPNLTLRNLSTADAAGLLITVSGFAQTNNCGGTLTGGGECSIAISGTGPGSISVSAQSATPQTRTIPVLSASVAQLPVVVSPKELDFGIVSAAGSPVVRTITVTNLTQQSQTFNSALMVNPNATLPYTFAEQTTDCTLAGTTNRLLAPGGTCHLTISLTASANPANDGVIRANWKIGGRSVEMTAYGRAAALSLSASEIDFGTQYTTALHLPRYLYLANNSTQSEKHQTIVLPAGSPFTVVDECPSVLAPRSVCRIKLGYQALHEPSADTVTLALDQGLRVLVTGRTLAQPTAAGASVNPNLNVSATSLTFATPVVVTSTSSSTQTVTVTNTGTAPFALSLGLAGNFIQTNNCGGTLAGGASCSVVLTFAPAAPGTRNGLLSLTAGGGTAPAFVALAGIGTEILSPATNGTIDLGTVPVGQPVVQWYKVAQSFTSFAAAASATSGAPFTVVLVEDIGYGHGQPSSSAYSASASGTCYNCWLGVRFDPVATGAEPGTLTLSSAEAGNSYVLSMRGTGGATSGLLLTPVSADFGSVAVNSTSSQSLFGVTNLNANQSAVMLSPPQVDGDFAVSNATSGGATCGGALAYGASCFVSVVFAPTATGIRAGALSIHDGTETVAMPLRGYGEADPGVALNPAALVFSDVPGSASTQQTVTVTNTGAAVLQIAAPVLAMTSSAATSFVAASNCGMLNAGASCTVVVTFTPASAQAAATLTIPVTSMVGGSAVVTNYAVPVSSTYTSESAGLQILPGQVQYGPLTTGSMGPSRQFTINNLSGKALTLDVALPRQFVLTGPPCAGLAVGASCVFSVAFLPLTDGVNTGTLFAAGTPTDGSAKVNGLAYVEGYGNGQGALSVTGGLLPGEVLDFGQVPSGQSTVKTLTVTNSSSLIPVTVRRITAQSPFSSTSTCGGALAPGASCSIAVSYAPVNQVAAGVQSAPSRTDTGTLQIESDAASSPDQVNLTGSVTPATVGSPSAVAFAAFSASPSSLTFAATQAGEVSAAQLVTLSNTGTGVVHILNLQSTADFTATSGCSTILPGASCTVQVTFTPQSTALLGAGTKTRAGAIEISSDALTPLEFVSVLGVATPSSLALAQTSLDFGPVQVGSSGSLRVQVTNTGPVGITFGALAATGDYTVSAGGCPLPGVALAPSTSCTLQVSFAPSQTGLRGGTLSIASSATTVPLLATLSGTGIQSHLQITPANLDFGPVAVGSAANLSLTLANTGTATISGIGLSATSGYNVSAPCAAPTLAPGASCSATVTFTPSGVGANPGTLIVVSSDASSPAKASLLGSGISNGSFSLSVNGSDAGSASVKFGRPASYGLTITPVNGFSGAVVLNCTPITPADFAYCSLVPSRVTLNGAPQNAAATINTVVSIAALNRGAGGRGFGETALGLLFPALLLSWKARTSPRRVWRRTMPYVWAIFATVALLTSSGCGGSGADPNLRYATPGTYQYQVTASSVGRPCR
ncbi:MAG: hypothetical protein NVSMB62_21150 [Acidobacteriaceae bacterium]